QAVRLNAARQPGRLQESRAGISVGVGQMIADIRAKHALTQ
ncbi:MAG: hypothetical protein JWP42_1523, partial [Pseudomonas sp.]|nr:hypothetical protein [Pseudomonas sp.]